MEMIKIWFIHLLRMRLIGKRSTMAVLMVDNVGYNLRIYSNIYAVSFFAHVFFSMMGYFDTTTPKYMVGIIYAFHF